jgi:hypothetical protein
VLPLQGAAIPGTAARAIPNAITITHPACRVSFMMLSTEKKDVISTGEP